MAGGGGGGGGGESETLTSDEVQWNSSGGKRKKEEKQLAHQLQQHPPTQTHKQTNRQRNQVDEEIRWKTWKRQNLKRSTGIKRKKDM